MYSHNASIKFIWYFYLLWMYICIPGVQVNTLYLIQSKEERSADIW